MTKYNWRLLSFTQTPGDGGGICMAMAMAFEFDRDHPDLRPQIAWCLYSWLVGRLMDGWYFAEPLDADASAEPSEWGPSSPARVNWTGFREWVGTNRLLTGLSGLDIAAIRY